VLKTGPKTQKLPVHRAAGPKNLNRIVAQSSHNPGIGRSAAKLHERKKITSHPFKWADI
jgi:hypothetical protein